MNSLHDLKIAIIGLGYVGLPLAVAFGKLRSVVGFDINQNRLAELQAGHDVTRETEPAELQAACHLRFSSQVTDLLSCNLYIITVPTPINEHKQPDLTPLIKASQTVAKVLKPGDIVIYESTVYPGCTEEDCRTRRCLFRKNVINLLDRTVDECQPGCLGWTDHLACCQLFL